MSSLRKCLTLLICFLLLNLQIQDTFVSFSSSASAQETTSTVTFEDVNKSEEFISLIIMLGIAVACMNLLIITRNYKGEKLQKSKANDIYAVYIGAAVFVFAEIQAFMKYQEIKNKTMTYNVSGVSEVQRQSLLKQREMFSSIKDAAKTKSKLQLVAALAFGGAVLLATTKHKNGELARNRKDEQVEQVTAAYNTPPTSDPAEAACRAGLATPYANFHNATMALRQAELDTFGQSVENSYSFMPGSESGTSSTPQEEKPDNLTTLKQAMANAAASNAALESAATACSAYPIGQRMTQATAGLRARLQHIEQMYPHDLFTAKKNEGDSEDGVEAEVTEFSWGTMHYQLFNAIFPMAYAGGSMFKMLGLGAVAIAMLKGTKKDSEMMFKETFEDPGKRRWVWAAMAAACYYASTMSKQTAQTMQENIDKIDQILSIYRQHHDSDNLVSGDEEEETPQCFIIKDNSCISSDDVCTSSAGTTTQNQAACTEVTNRMLEECLAQATGQRAQTACHQMYQDLRGCLERAVSEPARQACITQAERDHQEALIFNERDDINYEEDDEDNNNNNSDDDDTPGNTPTPVVEQIMPCLGPDCDSFSTTVGLGGSGAPLVMTNPTSTNPGNSDDTITSIGGNTPGSLTGGGIDIHSARKSNLKKGNAKQLHARNKGSGQKLSRASGGKLIAPKMGATSVASRSGQKRPGFYSSDPLTSNSGIAPGELSNQASGTFASSGQKGDQEDQEQKPEDKAQAEQGGQKAAVPSPFDFTLSGGDQTGVEQVAVVQEDDDDEDKGAVGKDIIDISKTSDVSIFALLTKRYAKTAFPILLKSIKRVKKIKSGEKNGQ
ncbi:MAG: hypothetical protein ISR65_07180 [Bacteriovoracaceae bacterium]|nr:hypothetical protein [Bacteriovoracaceae bacterium]